MSNKRNAALANAAFYAVLLFCLIGVGAGAYLLLFPDATASSASKAPQSQPQFNTPSEPEQQITEIIQPVTVPDVPIDTEPTAPADATPVDTTPVEVIQPEPPAQAAAPVSAPPAAPVSEPASKPVETIASIAADTVVIPLEGEVVAAFSMDTLVYNETLADWRTHDGIDISAEAGTGVLAAADGTVADVREDPLLGTTVVLQHSDGYRTTYGSLAPELAVKFGQRVSSGQLIGAVGTSAAGEASAGAHLHFAVSQNGKAVDPTEYLAS